MSVVQLVEVGDSLGVVLPDAVLARLQLTVGDVVMLTEAPEGIRLTVADACEGDPPAGANQPR